MSAPIPLNAKERAQLRLAEDAVEFARLGVEDAEDDLRIQRRCKMDAEAALHTLQEIQGWRS